MPETFANKPSDGEGNAVETKDRIPDKLFLGNDAEIKQLINGLEENEKALSVLKNAGVAWLKKSAGEVSKLKEPISHREVFEAVAICMIPRYAEKTRAEAYARMIVDLKLIRMKVANGGIASEQEEAELRLLGNIEKGKRTDEVTFALLERLAIPQHEVIAAVINELLAVPSVQGGPTESERENIVSTINTLKDGIHEDSHKKFDWSSYEPGDVKPGDAIIREASGVQTDAPQRTNGKYTYLGKRYDYAEFSRLVSNAHRGQVDIHLVTDFDMKQIAGVQSKVPESQPLDSAGDTSAIEKAKTYLSQKFGSKYKFDGEVYKSNDPRFAKALSFIKAHPTDSPLNAALDESKIVRVVRLKVSDGKEKGESVVVALDVKNVVLGLAN